MFLTLLIVTFAIATAVSVAVAAAFRNSVQRILARILADDISSTWLRYLMFAMFVVGISSGVRIWDLEKYVTKPFAKDAEVVQLTRDRWILEVYRTIIDTLQGLAWVLLVFFVIALIAFVLVRVFEFRRAKSNTASAEQHAGDKPAMDGVSGEPFAKASRGDRTPMSVGSNATAG